MAEAAQVAGKAPQDPSIRELMRRDGTGRPAEEIVRALARQRLAEADEILSAIDARWSPPPYDPLLVAQALGIRCKLVAASRPGRGHDLCKGRGAHHPLPRGTLVGVH